MNNYKSNDDEMKVSETAQEGLVSTVLAMPETYSDIDGVVSPDDFTVPSYRAIWEAIEALNADGKDINMPSVAEWLNANSKLMRAPVSEIIRLYNAGMMKGTTATTNAYAHIVVDNAARRRFDKMMAKLQELREQGKGATELFREASTASDEALASIVSHQEAQLSGEMFADNVIEAMHEEGNKLNDNGIRGIPTGYPTVDKITGGLKPQQVFCIGGRTGVGKTFTAIQITVKAAEAGNTVLFFSLEMGFDEIRERFLSYQSGVSLTKITNRTYNDEERQLIDNAAKQLKKLPFITIPNSNGQINIDYVCDYAAKQSVAQGDATHPAGLGLIIIDYLQLLGVSKKMQYERVRERQVADISHRLKELAMRLNIPVLSLVQLNRSRNADGSSNAPKSDDVRESYAIKQDASVFLTIDMHSSDAVAGESGGTCHFNIDKNRGGVSAYIPVHPLLSKARFVEVDQNGDSFTPDTDTNDMLQNNGVDGFDNPATMDEIEGVFEEEEPDDEFSDF